MADLAALGAGVRLPDASAGAEAAARLAARPGGTAALGRVADLITWAAAVTADPQPAPFGSVRVVLAAADHGTSRAAGPGAEADLRDALAGSHPVSVVAGRAGASVRLLDLGVDGEEGDLPQAVTRWRIRRGSGALDREDSLQRDEAERAVEAGLAVADEEADSGTDLLVPGALSPGAAVPAAVLAAVLLHREPVEVVDRSGGLDDAGWARRVVQVRDGLRRLRGAGREPLDLLTVAGGADVAFLTGLCLGAAVRRTPVLLDGPVVCVAALLASRLAPAAPRWCLAASRSGEPLHDLALRRLDLVPILDLLVRHEAGVGALLALPVLQSALVLGRA